MTHSQCPNTWQAAPAELTLAPHQVHIWRQDLQISSIQLADDEQLLNTEELATANQFIFAKHRRRYIAARAMLRKLLARYIAITPQNLTFENNAYGKPQLIDVHNPAQLQFSVSHSHELACYAVTCQHTIGIDIEWIHPLDYLGLAERFFANDEYQALAQLPTAQLATGFFRVWTQKEAFVKALGLGLQYPLDQFCVTTQPPANLIWLAQEDPQPWVMQALTIAPNYCAHLATPQPIHLYQGWQDA